MAEVFIVGDAEGALYASDHQFSVRKIAGYSKETNRRLKTLFRFTPDCEFSNVLDEIYLHHIVGTEIMLSPSRGVSAITGAHKNGFEACLRAHPQKYIAPADLALHLRTIPIADFVREVLDPFLASISNNDDRFQFDQDDLQKSFELADWESMICQSVVDGYNGALMTPDSPRESL